MANREKINRGKIEHWRLSRVPVLSTEEIYQGDLLMWNTVDKCATKATSGAIGTSGLVGMSDTSTWMPTLGSTEFLSTLKGDRVNVIQRGLVEVVWDTAETLYPFDFVTLGSNAQSCVKGAAADVGFVDPGWVTANGAAPSAGRAVVIGDLVRIWLQPAARFLTT